MSLKSNLAIILHLHNFKNLALPHKARYAIRAIIYQGKDMRNIAMPFNIIETETKPRRNVGRDSQIQETSFRSKRFNIEYHEEDIQLNDCCEFRLTLEGFPQLQEDDIYLQFILLENPTCYFRQDINAQVDMKEAERYKFKLQNIKTGIFKYCEGQYNETYISSFSFTLFLMLTDYRFHPYTNPLKSESNKDKAREKLESMEGLMKWSEKYVKNCQNGTKMFYQNYVKNLRYNSSTFQAEISSLFRMGEQNFTVKAPLGETGELIPVNQKQFFDYITSYYPNEITEELIIKQIYRINEQNFYFVQHVSHMISKRAVDRKTMKINYYTERRDMFGQRVFRSIVFGKEARDKEANLKIAKKMRKKKKIGELKIIDEYLFVMKKNQHYAFLEVNLPSFLKVKEYEQGAYETVLKQLSQQRFEKSKEKFCYDQRNMLVVLVHGYQASSYDMQLVKRQIAKMIPVAMYLVSSTNEINTDGDISLMGFKLAEEIKSYISRVAENENQIIINMVGHSMGGVIARASLKHLQKYKKQLGFFFSLSSPHLGYLNGVDAMIKTGLWVMRKMNKVQSLDQLSMEDSESLKNSFLYKLSETGTLRNFRKIILVSSSQDSYVPWHSARIEYHHSSNSSSKVEKQMIENILGDQIVHRVDVHFDIESTQNMDSFIGRAAHINLLTHESLFKLISEGVPNLYDLKQI